MFERLSRLSTPVRAIAVTGFIVGLLGGSIALGPGRSYLSSINDKNNETSAQQVNGFRDPASELNRSSRKDRQSALEQNNDGSKSETVTEEKKVPFDKATVATDELAKGITQILTPGSEGVVRVTYRITYRENESPLKQEISRTTITLPVTQVTAVGTRDEIPAADPAEGSGIPCDPATSCPDPLPVGTGCIFNAETGDSICAPEN